jgi:DNA (cytosine-5)-methyltransferase 1
MIENVRGLLDPRFKHYRDSILRRLRLLGYEADWQLLDTADFGVSQFRKRAILVAIERRLANKFSWPLPHSIRPVSVGEKLFDQMASRGWQGAFEWSLQANGLAPTIVGGSAKHGGPDLGPVRARKAWAQLGVDGKGVADEPPNRDFRLMPRLTVPMVARLQGFPDSWHFFGRKTAAYRQIGNAFPPPLANAVGGQIIAALESFRLFH